MSLQRKHFLLSYLKTLSVGPTGVRTHDLPHSSPVLTQPVVIVINICSTCEIVSCSSDANLWSAPRPKNLHWQCEFKFQLEFQGRGGKTGGGLEVCSHKNVWSLGALECYV